MVNNGQAYNPTMIPGCRWDFRRFLRAERDAQSAEANRDTIAITLTNQGFTLEWAARESGEYITAVADAAGKRARANERRQALAACLARMDRPDVIGPDPDAYINSRPETNEPASDPETHTPNPVPLPPGVTEEMDETDYAPPALAERCGAPSKNFARYGYCDRYASKEGNYCYSHA